MVGAPVHLTLTVARDKITVYNVLQGAAAKDQTQEGQGKGL